MKRLKLSHTVRLTVVLAVAAIAGAAHAQFGGWGATQTSPATNPTGPIGVGDWDGDGLQDMAYTGNASGPPLIIRFGDASAGLGTEEVSFSMINGTTGVNLSGQMSSIHAGDLDGDGVDDLVYVGVARTEGTNIGLRCLVVYGSLTRSFDPPSFVDMASDGSGIQGSALADVDGDGDLDILGINALSGQPERVILVHNLGSRQFGPGQQIASITLPGVLRGLEVGDLDGDGRAELVSGSRDYATVIFSDPDSDGQWSLIRTLSGGGTSGVVGQLTIRDFNGDDIPDIFTLKSSHTRVWLNDGSLGLTVVDTNIPSIIPRSLDGAVGDLDGDGDLDVLSMVQSNGTWRMQALLNQGGGVFAGDAIRSFSAEPQDVKLLDVDNNTTPDAIWSPQSNPATLAYALNLTDVVEPGPFTLTVPADGAVDLALPEHITGWDLIQQPRFRWSRPYGFIVTYDLSVSTTGPGAIEVYSATGLSDVFHQVPTGILVPGIEYEWQVTAHNTIGSSVAEAFTFTMAPGPRSCVPDLNGDGVLNFFDVLEFLSSFSAGCP